MGKPKKKQGIRRPGIAQQFESEDERERVKQRILQVFRSRLHSPHKAGALLVGTIPPGPDNTNNSRRDVYGVKMNHDDSSQDSGKVKRRRTRGELNRKRNRRRVTAAKEVAECTATQKLCHDRSEFCKQLKLAQDMASGAKSERTTKDRTLNAITNNRLTRNLGLFNQGKKSMAVSRESGLQVPESVRHQTEQDFKKIVCRSPEKPDFCSITISTAVETKSQTSCHRNLSTPIKIQSSSDTVQAVLVDEEMRSPNSLPSSPCMAEIAADLTAGLHPRSVFPQSNILHETKDELARLLKQNAPADGGSLMTPLGQTPGMRTTLLRSGLSSETVKRNLLDSLPPTATSNAEQQQVESGENFTFLSASQPTPGNHGNFPSPDFHRAMSAPSNHGDSDIPTMSACSLFRQSSATNSHSTQEMDGTHRETNALAYFHQPNRIQGAVYHNNTVYYMDRDHALNMVGDSSRDQVSRQYFPDAMETDIEMQSGIHNYNSLPTAGSEGGVVVCGNNTAYMPSHHADLHGLKHLQQVDMLRQHPAIPRPHQVDDLDLLDYLDLGGASSSHLAPQPPLIPYQHPPVTVQPPPDSPRPSSTNPSWYAALVIPPPQLHDTSPTHKLYPHRLY